MRSSLLNDARAFLLFQYHDSRPVGVTLMVHVDLGARGGGAGVTTAACWPPLRKRSPSRSGRRWSRSPARTGGRSTLHRRYDPRRTSLSF